MSKFMFLAVLPLLLACAAPAQAAPPLELHGTVQRARFAHQSIGAHIHIQLVNKSGHVVAERRAPLPPTAPRKDAGSNRRITYQVKFAKDEMDAAVRHQTIFHSRRDHSACASN
jgi:hypothetical protein